MAWTKQRFLINNLADGNVTASSQAAGTIRQPNKTGTGTASMTPSGSFTGASNYTVTVICDTAGSVDGAATIKWRTSNTATGAWEDTLVSATSTAMTLQEGIQIQFSAGTLVLNDTWRFPVYAEYGPNNLFVNGRDRFWKSGTWATLLTNGGFDSATTNWTAVDCTLASVAGGESGNCLEITRTAGVLQKATQDITCVVGAAYYLRGYVKSGTSGDEAFQVGVNGISYGSGTSSGAFWGSWTYGPFVATATTHTIELIKNTATAGTMLFDTIECFRSVTLTVNHGAAVQATVLALTDHNLSAAAIVTFQRNATDAWGSPSYSQTLSVTDPLVLYFDNTYAYSQILITDPDNTDGFLSIGKLYVGTYTQLAEDIAKILWGSDYATELVEDDNESDWGVENGHVYTERDAFELRFPALDATDVATYKTVFEATRNLTTGRKISIFIHYWTDDAATLKLCRRVSKEFRMKYVRAQRYEVGINWREEVITRTI